MAFVPQHHTVLSEEMRRSPLLQQSGDAIYLEVADMRVAVELVDEQPVLVNRPWPNGRIPYLFDTSVDLTTEAPVFREAARLWSLRANVTFQEISDTSTVTNWIRVVTTADRNSADVGMLASGEQVVEICNWDVPLIVAHELGHVLGLAHEQERSDRRNFVEILDQNIESGKEHNFQFYSNFDNTGPYDFASIMHYGLDKFAAVAGQPTILLQRPYRHLSYLCGQRLAFSYWDGRAIAERYGDTGFRGLTRLDTRSWPLTKSSETLPPIGDAVHGAVHFDVAVPGPDAVREVRFRTNAGSSGDCDLYVRRVPIAVDDDWTRDEIFASRRSWDWRSRTNGNAENLLIDNGLWEVPAVRYLVTLWADTAYEGVSLTVELVRT